MYYHHPEYQRQRHRERVAEMRTEYQRAQPQSHHTERMTIRYIRSVWPWTRRRSAQRAPAYPR